MFRPAIQSLRILLFMALFCSTMVFISIYFTTEDIKDGYEYKIEAAKYMEKAMSKLKKFTTNEGKVVDSSYDPLKTGLVFFKDGLEGNLDSKLTTLNPNFAALIVQFFLDAGLKEGDHIAVAFTGSMPGANIAVLSACEAMGVIPTITTSVSASNWGACDYSKFSWLDFEMVLSELFKYSRSKAASIGKGRDIGIGLSEKDINEIIISSKRNNIDLIYNKNKNLDFHINEKMSIYDQDFSNTKLFVNVGGGVASIGWYPGIKKITGFLSADSLNVLADKKLIHDCIMTRFSNRPNNPVPSLNIIDIENLVEGYLPVITLQKDGAEGLIFNPIAGQGILFSEKKYNMLIVIPCLIASLVLVLGVGLYSHFQIKKRMTAYEPD